MGIGISQNYANDKSFKVFVDYLALKKHFTTKGYDYHKYNGKVRASFEKFQTRSDLFYFYKLSRKRDYKNILISNMVKNPNVWIRDVIEENGSEVYNDWIKRIESLSYSFKIDLNKLKENYKDNFVVPSGQHPYLMTLYLQKHISFETFTILCHLSKTFDYWEKEIVDKIVASDIMLLSKKYYPFLEIDEKKFSKIVKERFF